MSISWPSEPRVLSIQSHVVHGCVGNRAALLPMNLLGVECDPLNVVHFSNHTGYKTFKGTRMSLEQYLDVVSGLEANGFFPQYSCVLTGYVGNAALLSAISDTIRSWRNQRLELVNSKPSAVTQPSYYVCDPVCGDNGKLYVAADVLPVYREQLLPLADIVTPNGFEASVLSGIEIDSVDSAAAAAAWFHERGPKAVVIKSFHLRSEEDESVQKNERPIHLFVSVKEQAAGPCHQYTMEFPQIPLGYVSGTGDVFAALVIGHLTALNEEESSGKDGAVPFVAAVERAVAAIHAVLAKTVSDDIPISAVRADGAPVKELALVRSTREIISPVVTHRAAKRDA